MNTDKQHLRQSLRAARRAHVAALDSATRALLFLRPPGALLDMFGSGDIVALYSAAPDEAPMLGYAKFFAERGHALVLPRFAGRAAGMEFARFNDPFGESDLEVGPYGVPQPAAEAELLQPDVLFVPLLGFTADGARIGQGGGHYDRYLAAHTGLTGIGVAWDAQLLDTLPLEDHDMRLHAVVTPTRLFGPF